MSTILVRCSVHAELSHETFSDWVERQRRELADAGSGVSGLVMRRIGHQELEIEVRCEPGDGHGAATPTAVRDFVADLTLLGMRPTVYVAAADAVTDRDVDGIAIG